MEGDDSSEDNFILDGRNGRGLKKTKKFWEDDSDWTPESNFTLNKRNMDTNQESGQRRGIRGGKPKKDPPIMDMESSTNLVGNNMTNREKMIERPSKRKSTQGEPNPMETETNERTKVTATRKVKGGRGHPESSALVSSSPKKLKTTDTGKTPTKKPQKKKRKARRFPCSLCEKVFVTKDGFDSHMNWHNGVRPYKCDRCGCSFYSTSARNQHWRISGNGPCHPVVTHVEGSKMPNSNKGKEVPDIDNQTKMRPKKTGQMEILQTAPALGPHQTGNALDKYCTVCDKQYASAEKYGYHMNKHYRVTPFECDRCGCAFSTPTSLNSHQLPNGKCRKFIPREELEFIPIPESIVKKLEEKKAKPKRKQRRPAYKAPTHPNSKIIDRKCEYCDTIIKGTLVNYNEHVRALHSDIRAFTCQKCNASFATSTVLGAHKRISKKDGKCPRVRIQISKKILGSEFVTSDGKPNPTLLTVKKLQQEVKVLTSRYNDIRMDNELLSLRLNLKPRIFQDISYDSMDESNGSTDAALNGNAPDTSALGLQRPTWDESDLARMKFQFDRMNDYIESTHVLTLPIRCPVIAKAIIQKHLIVLKHYQKENTPNVIITAENSTGVRDGKYYCMICNYKSIFKGCQRILDHINSTHLFERHQCVDCPKSYSMRWSLNSHITDGHIVPNEDDLVFYLRKVKGKACPQIDLAPYKDINKEFEQLTQLYVVVLRKGKETEVSVSKTTRLSIERATEALIKSNKNALEEEIAGNMRARGCKIKDLLDKKFKNRAADSYALNIICIDNDTAVVLKWFSRLLTNSYCVLKPDKCLRYVESNSDKIVNVLEQTAGRLPTENLLHFRKESAKCL